MTESARARPVRSVLDVLRARVDPDAFDAVVVALEVVVADLGFGDVRPIVGSLAWTDALRARGLRVGVVFDGDGAEGALRLAGVRDRFDAVVGHAPPSAAIDALAVPASRTVVVDVAAPGIAAARAAGVHLALGLARGHDSPEALRRAGADAVVADLQELL